MGNRVMCDAAVFILHPIKLGVGEMKSVERTPQGAAMGKRRDLPQRSLGRAPDIGYAVWVSVLSSPSRKRILVSLRGIFSILNLLHWKMRYSIL